MRRSAYSPDVRSEQMLRHSWLGPRRAAILYGEWTHLPRLFLADRESRCVRSSQTYSTREASSAHASATHLSFCHGCRHVTADWNDGSYTHGNRPQRERFSLGTK